MWVDENAGADPTGSTTGADDMTVTVTGQEYSADITMDVDSDGVEDTAVIERPDGSAQAFVDSDGDGDADSYLKLTEHGDVIARAAYDEASGDWVATEPGGGDGTGGTSGPNDPRTASGGMTADMPAGDITLGPPTVDTDDDGVADTAVAEDEAGNTLMFTDVNGDGAADIVVVVTPDGESATYEHTGDGEWTPVGGQGAARSSLLGAPVDDTATVGAKGWGGADSTNVFGVAHINPATGQWISPN